MISYHFIADGEYSFKFTTDQGIVYKATFFDYHSLFPDYAEFASDIFSFSLDIINSNTGRHRLDQRLGLTVVEIFKHFFISKERVIVYVCDSSDYRHFARKKKFDFWFWKYSDGTIIKEDGIAVIADFEIYNSILVHKDNKHIDEIIKAFKTLNERANDK